MKQWIMISLCLVVVQGACLGGRSTGVSILPPKDFQEKDLVGMWSETNDPYSIETLTIKEDQNFYQEFSILDSDYSYQGKGTWKLIYESSGCVYLHMQDMRFIYQVYEIAEKGNNLPDGTPVHYWDPCGERFIEMLNKTVLVVGSHPDSANGIMLWHVSTQKESINTVLEYSE